MAFDHVYEQGIREGIGTRTIKIYMLFLNVMWALITVRQEKLKKIIHFS